MLGESKFMIIFVQNLIFLSVLSLSYIELGMLFIFCVLFRGDDSGRTEMPKKRIKSLGEHVRTETYQKTEQGDLIKLRLAKIIFLF